MNVAEQLMGFIWLEMAAGWLVLKLRRAEGFRDEIVENEFTFLNFKGTQACLRPHVGAIVDRKVFRYVWIRCC